MRVLALGRSAAAALSGVALIALLGSCGLTLDPDPPIGVGVDAGGGCTRDSECPGCAICVAGGCAAAAGQPCFVQNLCEEGVYECRADGRPRCVSNGVIARAGAVCREASPRCDIAELCDGVSGGCPADVREPAGAPCRGGICDDAGECRDVCRPDRECDTGNACELGRTRCERGTEICKPAGPRPDGTVCRAQAVDQDCDAEEVCDGTSVACPPDVFEVAGTECRAAPDVCDVPEACTGGSPICPADGFAAAGAGCGSGATRMWCDGLGSGAASCNTCVIGDPCTTGRPCEVGSVVCDPEFFCMYAGHTEVGVVCRAAVDDCDVPESCTGMDPDCPSDSFLPSGAACRPSASPCDAAESCTGSSPACPPDGNQAIGTECRAPIGVCDVPETCTGGPSCPADDLVVSGTACRPAAGPCDITEACAGTSATCSTDLLEPAGTICRVSSGMCDAAELCDGLSTGCPSDRTEPVGTPCSGGFCNGLSVCNACTAGAPCGTGRDCQIGAIDCSTGAPVCNAVGVEPAGTTCRRTLGVCDPEEACDGVSPDCPADIRDDVTVCRPSTGPCELDGQCNGILATCPLNQRRSASAICRPSAGPCDVAETCNGASSSCPPNGVAPPSTVCRPAIGICDAPETCDGTSTACPPDGFLTGDVCRWSTGPCDVQENCDGASASCPPDDFAPPGTPCGTCSACISSILGSETTCSTALPPTAMCVPGEMCCPNSAGLRGTCVATAPTCPVG